MFLYTPGLRSALDYSAKNALQPLKYANAYRVATHSATIAPRLFGRLLAGVLTAVSLLKPARYPARQLHLPCS